MPRRSMSPSTVELTWVTWTPLAAATFAMPAVRHAIAACLTAGIANVAAARGVQLTQVNSTVEGDIDLLGIFGLSDGSVRNGYQQIKVTFHIEGDADDATLRGIVEQSRRRSAVYDVLTQPTPVAIEVVTG